MEKNTENAVFMRFSVALEMITGSGNARYKRRFELCFFTVSGTKYSKFYEIL